MKITKKTAAITTTVGLGLLALGGVAQAAIPANDGTITGCYTKSGSSLRVIDPSATNCKSSETQLQWNVAGPAGTDGTDGTNGQDGVSGYQIVTKDELFGPGFTFAAGSKSVDCPDGTKALGGGGTYIGDSGTPIHIGDDIITASYPKDDGSGWWIGYSASKFLSGEPTAVRVYATCATVLP